jgi:hypothetical protein
MHKKNFRRALFLTTTMLASAVFVGQAFAQSAETANAGNDAEVAALKTVVKCVASDGHITLTDAACPQGETSKPDTPAARMVVTEHYKLPAAEVHRKASVATPTPHKPSPDVATLKAARETMMMAQSTRQQRLAGLN